MLSLYNSATRRREEFVPITPGRVSLYVCGPTVYAPPHIGNARPALVFDVLVKLLRRRYKRVIYVCNITDIDDKINAAARRENKPISEIAARYAAIYHENMKSLGVAPPDAEPMATQHIPDIIAFIERLIAGGHAYEAEGHVLFDVPSFSGYGALSARTREDMRAGARVETAPFKRDAGDFVLWKPSSASLPGWESPWGRGRPGWHIECSAMIKKHLGETIDIHGGGQDLLFPHHENERAQSMCLHGHAPLARFWIHNALLNMGGGKMSKSEGNIITIEELCRTFSGEAIRLSLLAAHYRHPLLFSREAVAEAEKSLRRLYSKLASYPAGGGEDQPPEEIPEKIEAALCDDLNTPAALTALYQMPVENARDARALRAGGNALGLLQADAVRWLNAQKKQEALSADEAAEVEALIAQREEARRNGDFAAADKIRAILQQRGVILEDTGTSTEWRTG